MNILIKILIAAVIVIVAWFVIGLIAWFRMDKKDSARLDAIEPNTSTKGNE